MTHIEIAIPEKLLDRPKFNGKLVPYFAESSDGKAGEEGGIVVFGKADPTKWQECVEGKLCAMCGGALEYWIAFIGGPLSMKSRSFLDPGMHLECAEYALDVCPWMLTGRGDAERTLAVSPTKEPTKIEEADHDRVGLYLCHDYRVRRQTRTVNSIPKTMVYCYAGPMKREIWRERKAPESSDPEESKKN
jgi:hypothetical protein